MRHSLKYSNRKHNSNHQFDRAFGLADSPATLGPVCRRQNKLNHPWQAVVRNAGRFPDLTSPFPSGEPPAEGAEGAEGAVGAVGAVVYWEGGMYLHRSRFQQLPCSAETVNQKKPKKEGYRAWNLPTPIGRSKTPPRPLREVFWIRIGKRLPFRTGSS
jgi:hypothetical protein